MIAGEPWQDRLNALPLTDAVRGEAFVLVMGNQDMKAALADKNTTEGTLISAVNALVKQGTASTPHHAVCICTCCGLSTAWRLVGPDAPRHALCTQESLAAYLASIDTGPCACGVVAMLWSLLCSLLVCSAQSGPCPSMLCIDR
jgi:hypothetical protein